MEEIFNPYELRPIASLNRRRIIQLPGIEPEWVGKSGWELCSATALGRLIQERSGELGLDADRVADLPRRLNEVLARADEPARKKAQSIAETHGRRLGALIASILLSSSGLTSPPEDWERAYLRHWREEVRQIVLGGGLANGRQGEWIAAAAETMLGRCSIHDIRVRAAKDPSYLALVGAARRIPGRDEGAAVVADFGGTWAKSGIAYYTGSGELEKLLILPPVSTAALMAPGMTHPLAETMVSVAGEAIRRTGPAGIRVPDMMFSMAAYVIGGELAPPSEANQGGYYGLQTLSRDLRGWFSGRIGEASGQEAGVHFVHDGDAAAAALAGQARSAVIMMGSALGVGFVPPADGLRAMAMDFKIEFD